MMRRKVALLYGFGEGAWHGRQLDKALGAAGFEAVSDVREAEYIIAHSGGMYAVAAKSAGKTVLLVAPSCGRRGETWLWTQSKKVWQDMMISVCGGMIWWWLLKSFWNGVYLMKNAPRLPDLWQVHQEHQGGLPEITARVIVVLIENDPWSGYVDEAERAKHPQYEFVTVEGTHDDIWREPQRYVEMMSKEKPPRA